MSYNKTNSDWRHRPSLKNFYLRFVKCFPWPVASGKRFMNLWQKIFNEDLDVSHYLYAVNVLYQLLT